MDACSIDLFLFRFRHVVQGAAVHCEGSNFSNATHAAFVSAFTPWPPATELSPGDDDANEVYVRSHDRWLRCERAVRCAAVLQRCVYRTGSLHALCCTSSHARLSPLAPPSLARCAGRDKICSIIQNYCKFASDFGGPNRVTTERYLVLTAAESSLSKSRKCFRFLKWIREMYKIRRGMHRLDSGYHANGSTMMCTDAVCGLLDTVGHCASFFYFLIDNFLWTVTIGAFRSKEIPANQRKHWSGARRNGSVVAFLGGIRSIKRWRDYLSLSRTVVAFTANVLLLIKATRIRADNIAVHREKAAARARTGSPIAELSSGSSDSSDVALGAERSPGAAALLPSALAALRAWLPHSPDDPLLFHTIEVFGILSSMRILAARLSRHRYARLADRYMGILGMFGAACGMWRNWRKVLKKNCGSKSFDTFSYSDAIAPERARESPLSPNT